MLELMILGFLAERPHHGYDLRRRIAELYGFSRPISEGSLYPAIQRLIAAGSVTKTAEKGRASAGRHTLHLTEKGRARLHSILAEVDGVMLTDPAQFLVVLAFLGQLPDERQRRAVLQRRLNFISQPASFFYDGDRPLRRSEIDCPYRRGMLTIAGATSRAERAWLTEMLTPHDHEVTR